MTNKECNYFKSYKAIFPPRCNCKPCWFKYFKLNKHRVDAAKAVLKVEGGNVALVRIVGLKWVRFFLAYLEELKNEQQNENS
jgi:hypothetical protein